MKDRLRIVVLGMMGRCPFGGQTWLYLNWLSGLQRLGHEVWYLEDDTVWPYDPRIDSITDNCGYAVEHINSCLDRINMSHQWAFRLADRSDACWGLSSGDLNQLYKSCDVLLNIVGATDLREEQLAAKYRVYIETDPVTAELRLANGDEHTRAAFDNHHAIVTYGENYGAPDCGVPLSGRTYGRTRQPVDLELWPYAFQPEALHFSTIGNYRQKGNDEVYAGQTFAWSKHHEWQKFIELPARTSQSFEVALNVDLQDDREALERAGWQIVSPLRMSLDIFGAYPEFIRGSRGEWTVAKDQNIRLRSGWFSERDACYLASGKPVIAQDTAFANILPTGEGLFSFSTMEDILFALDAINSDYERHCRAARQIACEFFDAPMVAERLLRGLGL